MFVLFPSPVRCIGTDHPDVLAQESARVGRVPACIKQALADLNPRVLEFVLIISQREMLKNSCSGVINPFFLLLTSVILTPAVQIAGGPEHFATAA